MEVLRPQCGSLIEPGRSWEVDEWVLIEDLQVFPAAEDYFEVAKEPLLGSLPQFSFGEANVFAIGERYMIRGSLQFQQKMLGQRIDACVVSQVHASEEFQQALSWALEQLDATTAGQQGTSKSLYQGPSTRAIGAERLQEESGRGQNWEEVAEDANNATALEPSGQLADDLESCHGCFVSGLPSPQGSLPKCPQLGTLHLSIIPPAMTKTGLPHALVFDASIIWPRFAFLMGLKDRRANDKGCLLRPLLAATEEATVLERLITLKDVVIELQHTGNLQWRTLRDSLTAAVDGDCNTPGILGLCWRIPAARDEVANLVTLAGTPLTYLRLRMHAAGMELRLGLASVAYYKEMEQETYHKFLLGISQLI